MEVNQLQFIQKIFVRDEKSSLQPYENFVDKDIFEFPAKQKINMLIEDGDKSGLLEIIDRVIESDNPCPEKK